MALSATDVLVSEILTVIAQNGSYWDRCCCPDPTTGLPETTMLANLQTNFPLSNWTTALVLSTLAYARRIGLIKQIQSTWFIFQNLLAVNPANSKFLPFAGRGRICVPPCPPRPPATVL